MGALSIAGALCYAELTTRFPKAGGGYVFLREAFGPRRVRLRLDGAARHGPGHHRRARHRLRPVSARRAWRLARADVTSSPIAAIVALRPADACRHRRERDASCAGRRPPSSRSSRARRRGAIRGARRQRRRGHRRARGVSTPEALAASVIAAFFAFGGWWELGRMSEEVESPRRTMPRALIGGLALVTAIYASVSVAYMLGPAGPASGTDEAFVLASARRCSARRPGACSRHGRRRGVGQPRGDTARRAARVSGDGARRSVPGAARALRRGRGPSPASTLVQVSLACAAGPARDLQPDPRLLRAVRGVLPGALGGRRPRSFPGQPRAPTSFARRCIRCRSCCSWC